MLNCSTWRNFILCFGKHIPHILQNNILCACGWLEYLYHFVSKQELDKKLNILECALIFKASIAVADCVKVSLSDGLYTKLVSQLQVYLNLTRIQSPLTEKDGLKCFSEAGFSQFWQPGWLQRVLLTCTHSTEMGSARQERPLSFRGMLKNIPARMSVQALTATAAPADLNWIWQRKAVSSQHILTEVPWFGTLDKTLSVWIRSIAGFCSSCWVSALPGCAHTGLFEGEKPEKRVQWDQVNCLEQSRKDQWALDKLRFPCCGGRMYIPISFESDYEETTTWALCADEV